MYSCMIAFFFFSLANLVYKAILSEVSSKKPEEIVHPYTVALGVICLQKVMGT